MASRVVLSKEQQTRVCEICGRVSGSQCRLCRSCRRELYRLTQLTLLAIGTMGDTPPSTAVPKSHARAARVERTGSGCRRAVMSGVR